MRRADIDLLQSALDHLIAGLEDLKAVVASLAADEPEALPPPAPPEPDRELSDGLLTTAEVAQILRCHRDTVYKMLDSGQLAEVRVGHKRLIDAESLPQPSRAEAPVHNWAPPKPRQMRGELVDAVARIRGAA